MSLQGHPDTLSEGGAQSHLDEESIVDDDLGSLISFANLENVVKHIIRKFKSIESHGESIESALSILKKDLDTRCTNSMLDEVSQELVSKINGFSKTLIGQRESLTGLEGQLERNRALCSAIDKKLEATVKEKTVQDRLIRETQDALQDKVTLAELNMFEAKFAGYTTKLELQDVINMLSHYSRVDVTESIAKNVKVLATQFEDYPRVAKVDQQLQELRDWVSDELQYYAKAATTAQQVSEIQTQIRDQALSFERVHALMDDKIRAMSDRMTSIYTELDGEIAHRALEEDLRDLQRDMKRYALRGETEAFQQDCVPKLKFCVDSIKSFDDRLKAQDDAIQRVDEVLLDKASKYDVVVANSRIEQCFPKEKAMSEFGRMFERLEWMNKKVDQYIESETERLMKYKPIDYTPMFDEVNSKVALKADKADLVEMYQVKANRIDADELSKLQETIHCQLEYLAVTNFGLSRLVLTDAKAGESKTIRSQQKAQVLMQSEKLWHWILHNEPPPNLDTLRPPGYARKSKHLSTIKDEQVSADASEQAADDKEKRLMDDQKRLQLEKKFGIQGA